MKNKIIILLMILILAISFTNLDVNLNRTPIQEATYQELIDIEDIGDTLATRILIVLRNNKTTTIEDLEDIKGIGEERLKLIKKVYK